MASDALQPTPRPSRRCPVFCGAENPTLSTPSHIVSSPPHPSHSSVSFLFSPCSLVPCEPLANRKARLDPPVLDCSGVDLDVALHHRLPPRHHAVARKVLGWPKRHKLAHAFLWEYSYKGLKLAQLLGQVGVFLTRVVYCPAGQASQYAAPKSAFSVLR